MLGAPARETNVGRLEKVKKKTYAAAARKKTTNHFFHHSQVVNSSATHAPSMEGVASPRGVQNPMSPQVLTKLSRPPPVHNRTAAKYLPWFD